MRSSHVDLIDRARARLGHSAPPAADVLLNAPPASDPLEPRPHSVFVVIMSSDTDSVKVAPSVAEGVSASTGPSDAASLPATAAPVSSPATTTSSRNVKKMKYRRSKDLPWHAEGDMFLDTPDGVIFRLPSGPLVSASKMIAAHQQKQIQVAVGGREAWGLHLEASSMRLVPFLKAIYDSSIDVSSITNVVELADILFTSWGFEADELYRKARKAMLQYFPPTVDAFYSSRIKRKSIPPAHLFYVANAVAKLSDTLLLPANTVACYEIPFDIVISGAEGHPHKPNEKIELDFNIKFQLFRNRCKLISFAHSYTLGSLYFKQRSCRSRECISARRTMAQKYMLGREDGIAGGTSGAPTGEIGGPAAPTPATTIPSTNVKKPRLYRSKAIPWHTKGNLLLYSMDGFIFRVPSEPLANATKKFAIPLQRQKPKEVDGLEIRSLNLAVRVVRLVPFLRALYDSSFDISRTTNVVDLADILSISWGFGAQELHRKTVKSLQRYFPPTVDAFASSRYRRKNISPAHLFYIANTCGETFCHILIPSVIAALYEVPFDTAILGAEGCPHKANPTTRIELAPNIKYQLFRNRSKLTSYALSHTLGSLYFKKRSCRNRECMSARRNFAQKCMLGREDGYVDPFLRYPRLFTHRALCDGCQEEMEECVKEGRAFVWDKLPSLLGIPMSWEAIIKQFDRGLEAFLQKKSALKVNNGNQEEVQHKDVEQKDVEQKDAEQKAVEQTDVEQTDIEPKDDENENGDDEDRKGDDEDRNGDDEYRNGDDEDRNEDLDENQGAVAAPVTEE
ncbi:hypothetical protein EIP91_012227 [Steccherinum ochraceum]|uniref:BTB domain-containing protein n=1 Tax=Steccherinum ochraceum TaxID=92696 RepID=A0A4V2MWU5_9APHY|nr:hypothetical protein EIP91_012227 [Steccherinum ochraceum]